MTREWLDTIGTLVGAIATVAGAIIIPIFIFNAGNRINEGQLDAQLKAEDQRSKQETLQQYLNQMGTLLIDNELRTADEPEVRTLARARTATVIQMLDADGNRNVVRFLNESGLTGEASLTGNGKSSISLLAGADLRGARLEGVDLSTMDLSGANLRHAILKDADLYQANLNGANLSYSTLNDNLELVSLNGADLYGAILKDADLDGADMRDSALSGANLNGASLWSSILVDAKLSGADMSDAILKDTALDRAQLRGIFKDNFSDASSGWDTATGSETERYVLEYRTSNHTSKYRVYNPPPGNTLSVLNPSVGSAIEDVSVKVDAKLTENIPQNKDYSWGIICRADAQSKNLYELGIFADGSSAIWKQKDNHKKVLDSERPEDAVVHVGAATNHFRADCSGSTLALYVNDRKLVDASEASGFESGKQSGLYVSDSHNGEAVNILFDNFVVAGPKAKGLP